jgi:hypothetical protein
VDFINILSGAAGRRLFEKGENEKVYLFNGLIYINIFNKNLTH